MNESSILLYETGRGRLRVDVHVRDETGWLTQKSHAGLFGEELSAITTHLKNIFVQGELNEHMVCANFAHTTEDELDEEVVCRKSRHTTPNGAITGGTNDPS